MLATIVACSYVILVMIVAAWRFCRGDEVFDHTLFQFRPEVVLLTSVMFAIFVAVLWFNTFLNRRRDGLSLLIRRFGAHRVSDGNDDPYFRRLLNINEEVAIASGLAPVDIFAMPREDSINAFTVGTTTEDAAVFVTQGALRQLKRAELQAVIAHEYAHMLNGDVQLNTRLLFFLSALSPMGAEKRPSSYLRLMKFLAVASLLTAPTLLFGARQLMFFWIATGFVATLVWAPVKFVGLFWAAGETAVRATHAAVSRQRELAADAGSATFTRDPESLASALRKVEGLGGQEMPHEDAARLAHMCFVPVRSRRGLFARWFDMHPPLEERLHQLGFPLTVAERRQVGDRPEFRDPRDAARMDVDEELSVLPLAPSGAQREVTRVAPPGAPGSPAVAPRARPERVSVATAITSVPDVAHAAKMLGRIPDVLRTALRKPAGACAAAHVLLGDTSDRRPGTLAADFAAVLLGLGPEHRLAMLELAVPTLRAMPRAEQDLLIASLRSAATADRRISLREAVYFVLLTRPMRVGRPMPTDLHTGDAFAVLIGAAALAGTNDDSAAAAAFAAGRDPGFPGAGRLPERGSFDFARLEAALLTLEVLPLDRRQRVLAAVIRVVTHDGMIQVEELELLRAVGAALDLPIPPVAASEKRSTTLE